MIDDQFDPIETSSGQRPRASVAERGAVGLALLALVGGLLIAGGNFLTSVNAKPSPSGVADATPRETPQPTPPPLAQVILEPGSPPSASPAPVTSLYSGWIRATTTITTRLAPALDAGAGEALGEGEVAYADERPELPGWLSVTRAADQSWIEPAIAASAQVQRIQPQPFPVSGYVWGLTAGRGGFLANIVPAGMSDGNQQSRAAFSRDGVHWQATDLPAGIGSFASGPAGWLAVATDYTGQQPSTTIWRSSDGRHWDSLGYAPQGLEGNAASQIVASDGVYLIDVYAPRGGLQRTQTWWSRDGVAWRQSEDPLAGLPSGSAMFVGLPSGFYAWDSTTNQPHAAFSVDGSHWSATDGGPAGQNVHVVQVGPRVIAVASDPVSGVLHTFSGTTNGQTLVWDDPAGIVWPQDSGSIGLAALVSDGERALMFAWNRETEAVVAWESPDGAGWSRVALPENAFGGIPRSVAGGPTGIVVLGYRQTARGENPIFWHRTGSGWWAPEPSPIVHVVPDPPRTGCPPAPASGLDFVLLDRPLAVACLGNKQIMFRAWSVTCDGCGGGNTAAYQPSWLAVPGTNQLYLSPIDGGQSVPVVLPPVADIPDPSWTPKLLELTGHFDDPAATSCRWKSSPDEDPWYNGQRGVVDSCRQQFVVTAVKVIGSP